MSRPRGLEMVERGNRVLSLRRQCSLLGISRARFYRERSPRRRGQNEGLMARIDRPFLEMPYYGSRKMRERLKREG